MSFTGTSHVPCKFYRQGACQAGKACPFLHSDEPVTERAPCKYFTKARSPRDGMAVVYMATLVLCSCYARAMLVLCSC